MKKLILLIIFSVYGFSQNYEIENIRAIGNIPFNYCSDIWGYTAPNGHEFALVGRYNGTSIVDISTNPHNPVEVGFIPGASSGWRDLKVHSNYCYVTNESGGGLDIIDLSDPFNPVKVGAYTATFTSAHNIFIADGYAYIFGANAGSGGCRILDLATDPENPTEVGSWEETYFHDGYVKNDTLYGSGIYDGSLYIVNVSDKLNPVTMVEHNYSNYGSHAVWVSGDSKYAITADEKSGGFINIYDIRNFSNINLLSTWYPNESQASLKTVHNVFWKDDLLYISYYVYGTRIVDMSNPSNPVEVGYYDFYPGDAGLYSGNWGTYPYTSNGLIYSTDFSGNGFFVMSYPFYGEIEFEELNDIEDNVSSIPLWVTVEESPDYTIDYSTLMLYWGLNGTITDSVVMSADELQYTGSIVPNGEDGDMHYYVSFYNTDGSIVTKPYDVSFSTFTFYVGPDTQDPVILHVNNPSGSIKRTSSKTILTEVSDNIGISAVNLFYTLDGNNWLQAEMNLLNTVENVERYSYELEWENIPIPTVISYYVECIDASQAANTVQSNVKEFQIGYYEVVDDFESGLNNWDLGSGWGLSVFGADESFAVHDSPNGNYENNQTTSLTLTYPYDLSPYSGVTLSFSHFYLTWPNQDYCFVEVSVDSINWEIVATYSGWQGFSIGEELDFTPWTGSGYETVYLRFTLETSSTETADGWHIDNITWETIPSLGTGDQPEIPNELTLFSAYPNPFNPVTTIQYSLPVAGIVDLKIYDLMGREIRSLVNAFTNAGIQSVIWDAKDNYGNSVSSGVYIYKLKTREQMFSKKLILLK